MMLVGDAQRRLQEVYCLYSSQKQSVRCGSCYNTVGSVPLRLSFDTIAVDYLVGTSAKDDAER